MPTSSNLSPSDLLLAYIAGDLDEIQETLLFSRLMESSDLRTEFRDYLAIDSLVRRDADTITLPAGLKAVTMGAVVAQAHKPTAWLWTHFRVSGVALLSAVLGCVLALVLQQPTALDSSTHTAQNNTDPVVQQYRAGEQQHTAPPTTSKHRTEYSETTTAAHTQSTHRRNGKQPATHADTLPATAAENAAVAIEYAHQAASPEPTLSLHSTADRQQHAIATLPTLLPALSTGLHIDVRGTALSAFQTTDIPSQSDPWFNNTSIGLRWQIGERHSIGVELGQEAFPQFYSGTDNGRSVYFEQRPVLLWAGGVYQYTADRIDALGGIRPFSRITAGGTVTGPIARAIAGLQYTPDARVSLWLGAEGSLLLYKFQDTWFSSQKAGLSYGISIVW